MTDRAAAATLMGATVLVVWGLITHGTFAGSGDEPHYLMIARSIAFDGDVHLANDYGDPGSLIGGGTLEAGPHVRPGRNGVPRPVHDLGLPVMAAPAVRVMYPLAQWIDRTLPRAWLDRARLNASLLLRHQLSLLMAVVAGLIAIEMWRMLSALGFGQGSAMRWALLFTLSPPLLSFSFVFFTELVSALIVIAWLRRIATGYLPPRRALLMGAVAALLTFIHVRNAPITLVLAAVGLRQAWPQRRSRIALLVGLGAGLALRTAVNWHFWGSLVTNPHARLGAFESVEAFVGTMAVRLSGLVFDQEYGLLPLAPVYVLAIAGFVRLYGMAPNVAAAAMAVVAAYLLPILTPVLNVHGWTGEWSPAPRFLVPVVPLLAIAVAAAAAAARGARAVFVRVLVGLQIAAAVLVWNEPKVLWNDGNGVSAVVDAWPALRGVYGWMPSWFGEAASPPAFAVAAVIAAAITAWLLASDPDGRRTLPARSTVSPRLA